MLFIYRVLPMGGIETFFVRMAKERYNKKLNTTILLLSAPGESNSELLHEMKKYATVLFYYDLFYKIPVLSKYFPLLAPVKREEIKKLFHRVDQIHAFVGMHALLGQRLSLIAEKIVPITIGFYHYITYVWGGNNIAHHEKVSREFVFRYLPKESLLFFSEGNREFYSKHKGLDFARSNTFRLGVVDKKEVSLSGQLMTPLKICAVGRLIEFKSYNLYMLDLLKRLLDEKLPVQFDIYGDGPLYNQMEKKITELDLQNNVFLKGILDYSLFDKTVAQYDLFIGSGTAIIQAASLGVPSIVGIENTVKPKTYGYFSEVNQFEYNLKGLNLPLIDIEGLIKDYVMLTESQRFQLKRKHFASIDSFTNETCQVSIDQLKNIDMPNTVYKYNRWLYEISRALDQVGRLVRLKHPYNLRHEEFKMMDKP